MYINTKTGKYPYTLKDFREDNPRTSYPENISKVTLNNSGVYEVYFEADPEFNSVSQKVVTSDKPVLEDGRWVIKKTAEDLPQEEAEASVRAKRDSELLSTDWIVIKAYETGSNIPAEWELYRQALRDITDHVNFPHLADEDWPIKP